MSSDPLVPTPEFLAQMLADDTAAFLSSTPSALELADYNASLAVLLDTIEDSVKRVQRAAIAVVNQAMVG